MPTPYEDLVDESNRRAVVRSKLVEVGDRIKVSSEKIKVIELVVKTWGMVTPLMVNTLHLNAQRAAAFVKSANDLLVNSDGYFAVAVEADGGREVAAAVGNNTLLLQMTRDYDASINSCREMTELCMEHTSLASGEMDVLDRNIPSVQVV